MNHTDFIAFQRSLARFLPNIANWLSELAKEQGEADSGEGTIRANWAKILGDSKPEEYRDVLCRIAALEIPLGNWQELPGLVRREVVNRRPKPRNEYLDQHEKWQITGELSEAFKEVRECGKDPQHVRDVMDKWIAKWSQDASHEPRYRCWDCRDVGVVTCWHVQCLKDFKAGRAVRPMTMAVKCLCDASVKFGDNKHPNPPMPRYQEYKFCRWESGELSEVEQWFEWRKTKGISSHPNFNTDLVIVGSDS